MKSGKSFLKQVQDKEKQAIKELQALIKKGEPIPEDTDKYLVEKAAKKIAKNKHYGSTSVSEVMDNLKAEGWLDKTPEEEEAAKEEADKKDPPPITFGNTGVAVEMSEADIKMMQDIQKAQMQQQIDNMNQQLLDKSMEAMKKMLDKSFDPVMVSPETYKEYLESKPLSMSATLDPASGSVKFNSVSPVDGNIQSEETTLASQPLKTYPEVSFDFNHLKINPVYRKEFFEEIDKRIGPPPIQAVCINDHGVWVGLDEAPKEGEIPGNNMMGVTGYGLDAFHIYIRPPMGVKHIPESLITREFRIERDWWTRPRFSELKMRNVS